MKDIKGTKYWLHPKISWKVFKKLNTPFGGDIVPKHGDTVLWQMLRERKINMYLSNLKKDKDDPMIITTKPIKDGMIIGNKSMVKSGDIK